MNSPSHSFDPLSELPVMVVLERTDVRQGRWVSPRWTVVSVIPGRPADSQFPAEPVRTGGDRNQYCVGLVLRLHKDSTESYRVNLTGSKPSLFVVLQSDDAGNTKPVLVSADYDEASVHMEGDDLVLSTPLRAEIRRWLEAYVRTNYRPVEGKRKRGKPVPEESPDGRGSAG